MPELSRDIRKLALVPLAAFLALCLACGFWQVLAAPRLQNDPNNGRPAEARKRCVPGRMYSADGALAMGADRTETGWKRSYPTGDVFCHFTGYNDDTGLVPGLIGALTGEGAYYDLWANLMYGRPVGADVVLTVNAAAQMQATSLLRHLKGAVVALDAKTGAVLCLASSPSYDPREVTRDTESFELFHADPESPELDRAVQGLYPPGSVLKIFTAAAALDAGVVKPDQIFTCAGEERIAGTVIKCRRAGGHGRIPLSWAIADSCNIVLAKVGQALGPARFEQYVQRFHLLDAPALPFAPGATQPGRMVDFVRSTEADLLEASFGQGKTLLTPYAIARMTLAIANGGAASEPYLIKEIRTQRGAVLERGSARQLGQAVGAAAAQQVAGMMVETVEKGTGKGLGIRGVSVAGKTGSAQNPRGAPHAWVTAFAPADDPAVVVTVVVENGGSGGETAAPIARQVMETLLRAGR
jgi:penicillin-binding protein A